MPSVEVAIEKLVQAVTSIVRCLAVVFQPVPQHGPAGPEVRVIETVVRAGIHNKLDWRAVVDPGGCTDVAHRSNSGLTPELWLLRVRRQSREFSELMEPGDSHC